MLACVNLLSTKIYKFYCSIFLAIQSWRPQMANFQVKFTGYEEIPWRKLWISKLINSLSLPHGFIFVAIVEAKRPSMQWIFNNGKNTITKCAWNTHNGHNTWCDSVNNYANICTDSREIKNKRWYFLANFRNCGRLIQQLLQVQIQN